MHLFFVLFLTDMYECNDTNTLSTGIGDSSVVERRTRGLNDQRRFESRQDWDWGGRIFFSGVTFCADSFRYPFHRRVTAVARARSWSFCQKCMSQVTPKHTCSLVCGIAWSGTVNWCMVVLCTQNVCRAGSNFTWHQPCNNQNSAVSTPLGRPFKNALQKAAVSHSEWQAIRAQWVYSREENSAI